MNRVYLTKIIRGLRLLSQLFFLIIFGNLTILLGFAISFDAIKPTSLGIPVPVEQPVAAPFTTAFNLFELLQWEITHAIFPFLSIGLICLYGLVLGNSYCSWVCPFGFIQEVIGWLPVRKRIPSKETNNMFKQLKYGILLLCILFSFWICYMVVMGGIVDRDASMFGVFVDIVSGPISQSTTLFSLIPTPIIENPFALIPGTIWDIFMAYPWFFFRVILLLIILLLSMYISQFWCRYFCPTGALFGIFNKIRFIHLSRDPSKCLGKKCRECEVVCPMGVLILEEPFVRIASSDCTMCMKCYNVCDKDAIKVKFF